MACFLKIYLHPELLYYKDVTYIFGNLRTGARKKSETNYEFWGRA
jgi:hypothetical protein